MQGKLLRLVFLYPFVVGLLASFTSTRMGADPAGPEPREMPVWIAWTVASGAWEWFMGLWAAFLWPGETITGFQWDGATMGQSIVTFAVAYAVWGAVVPAGLNALGLWDWFSSKAGRSVSQELNGWWVWLRDWFEEVTAFGKGPAAKWAGMADMKAWRWRRGDIFLGRPWTAFGGRSWPVGISTEKHMVTIAGTGSGKSTGALIPNLCLHEGPVLCIDPKGELARITARQRRKRRGREPRPVYILDPFRIAGQGESDSYNPFDEMAWAAIKNPERVVSFAARIAEALVKDASQKDPYFDNAAKSVLAGLVLYVYVHEPEEQRTLVRVRELLTEGYAEGYAEAVREGLLDKDDTRFDFLITKMKSVRKEPYGEAIARAAGTVDGMSAGQRDSVLTTAQEHTAWLDNPVMAKVVRGDAGSGKLRLDDLREWRISIYVCLPITAITGEGSRWLRLLVLMFIEVMMFDSENAPNPPVLLAIDEFPSLGKIDRIEVIGPLMRSYGVRLWVVGQDISQFKDVYPETWTSFIGNAEAVQFMGTNHPSSVDFISDLLGHHVVETGMGTQARKEAHPLMDRDQVSRFLAKHRGNQIIWFGSRRPMKLKICPYFQYLMPWYYDPDRRYKESLWRRFLRAVGQ